MTSLKCVWAYNLSSSDWVNRVVHADRIVALGYSWVFLGHAPTAGAWADWQQKARMLIVGLRAKNKTNPVQVHANIFEDWDSQKTKSIAAARVQKILDYNKSNPTAPFSGIHSDAEPHTSTKWDSKSKAAVQDIATEFREFISAVRLQMNDVGLGYSAGNFPLSAAVGWWYDTRSRFDGDQPWENYKIPNFAAVQLCDSTHAQVLVPMVYNRDYYGDPKAPAGATEKQITDKADTMMTHPGSSVRVIVGIGAADLLDPVPKVADSSTLATLVKALDSYYTTSGLYSGTSLFRYEQFPRPTLFILPWGHTTGDVDEWKSPDLVTDNPPVKGGFSCRLTARVHNLGGVAAAGVKVSFYYSPNSVGAFHPIIFSNLIETVSIIVPADAKVGEATLDVSVDWYIDPQDHFTGGRGKKYLVDRFDSFTAHVVIKPDDASYTSDLYNHASTRFVNVKGFWESLVEPVWVTYKTAFMIGNPMERDVDDMRIEVSLPASCTARLAVEERSAICMSEPFPMAVDEEHLVTLTIEERVDCGAGQGVPREALEAALSLMINGERMDGFSMRLDRPGRPSETGPAAPGAAQSAAQ